MKCKFYENEYHGVRSEIPYTRFLFFLRNCYYVLAKSESTTIMFQVIDRGYLDNAPEFLIIVFDYLPEDVQLTFDV